MSRNDGGPAFPSPGIESATDDRREQRDGMTLRDYFAAMAMQELVSSPMLMEVRASVAYKMADAMLAERSKPLAEREKGDGE